MMIIIEKNNEKIHKREHVIKVIVCKRRTNTCIYTVILTLMFTCKITTLCEYLVEIYS